MHKKSENFRVGSFLLYMITLHNISERKHSIAYLILDGLMTTVKCTQKAQLIIHNIYCFFRRSRRCNLNVSLSSMKRSINEENGDFHK